MATDAYRAGLAREAVAMRMKGKSAADIQRSLGVDREFISKAWSERYDNRPLPREWGPDHGDVNETGGY